MKKIKRYRLGNLKKNVLTYEEIISGVLKQIPVTQDENVLWAAHVNSAIELTSKGQLARMAIAELAERACVIFHGSHRIKAGDPAPEKHVYAQNLKRFARGIHVNYRTLSQWVRTKRIIYDVLPKEDKDNFKFTAASKLADSYGVAVYESPVPPEEIIEKYRALAAPAPREFRRKKMYAYLRQVHFFIVTKDQALGYSLEELEPLKEWARGILARIVELESIHAMKSAPPKARRKVTEKESLRSGSSAG